jgi:hypothetical protein
LNVNKKREREKDPKKITKKKKREGLFLPNVRLNDFSEVYSCKRL